MFFQLFGGAIFLSKNVIISLVTSFLTSSNKCVENQKRLFGIVMQWRNIFFSFLRMYAMSIVVVKKAFRWASKFFWCEYKKDEIRFCKYAIRTIQKRCTTRTLSSSLLALFYWHNLNRWSNYLILLLHEIFRDMLQYFVSFSWDIAIMYSQRNAFSVWRENMITGWRSLSM